MKTSKNIILLIAIVLSVRVAAAQDDTRSSKTTTSPKGSAATSPSIMDDYDDETLDQGEVTNSDLYRGRSKWSPEQFGKYADSVGIESRSGQSAAVAHIITSMRKGDLATARTRLRRLLATPGYMLDSDVAQVLLALDMVLQNNKYNEPKGPTTARVDTVYRIDTVAREIVRVDTVYMPAPAEPKEPAPLADQVNPNDTVFIEVVKYDTVYVNNEEREDVTEGPTEGEQLGSPQNSAASAASKNLANAFSDKVDRLTNEVLSLQRQLRETSTGSAPDAVTRICFTIHVKSYTNRSEAERTVERLRLRYPRARLAISNGAPAPYSVIIGYYRTAISAMRDAAMVSRTIGQRCRAVQTTIAERL